MLKTCIIKKLNAHLWSTGAIISIDQLITISTKYVSYICMDLEAVDFNLLVCFKTCLKNIVYVCSTCPVAAKVKDNT